MLVSRFDHRPDSVADRVQTGFRHVDRAAVEASFKKAAFGAGDASADPAERWNQIRRGLSAIRGGEPARPAVLAAKREESAANASRADRAATSADAGEELPALKIPAVAPEILAPAAHAAKPAGLLTEADAAASGAAEHWMKVRQAMKSGLLEKVEIANVETRGGETLADLAALHMGDPRKARILAKFNNLPLEGALGAGVAVRIPTGGIIDRLRMHEYGPGATGLATKPEPEAPAMRKARPAGHDRAERRERKAVDPPAVVAAGATVRPVDRIEMMLRQIKPVKI